MPVSLTTITGPVYLPNGATPVGGRVSFELSSWDQEEGAGLVISGPVYTTIDNNGQFSVELYTSTAGVNSVHYRMFVIWEDSELSESYVNDIYVGTPTPHYTKKYIGSFALSGPGPFQVSDLNIISETNNSSFDAYLEMKAFADRIDLGMLDAAIQTTEDNAVLTLEDRNAVTSLAAEALASKVASEAAAVQTGLDRTAAALSAAQAALYDGPRRTTVTQLLLDASLTYTTGTPSTVAMGDSVRVDFGGFAYQVAASGASDHHITTAGGVKLYVVPGQDVRAFGAVGDGVTNDTVAVLAAAAAGMKSANSGTYLVTDFAIVEDIANWGGDGAFRYAGTDLPVGPVTAFLQLDVPSVFSTIQKAIDFVEAKTLKDAGFIQIKLANGDYGSLVAPLAQIEPQLTSGHDRVEIIGNPANKAAVKLFMTAANNACGFLFQRGNGLFKIDGMTIVGVGGRTAHGVWNSQTYGAGIMANYNSQVLVGANVEVDGFYYSFVSRYGSAVRCEPGVVARNAGDCGFFAYAASMDCQDCQAYTVAHISDGLGFGFCAEAGGFMDASRSNASGCHKSGFYANGAGMWAKETTSDNNQGDGFLALNSGRIEVNPPPGGAAANSFANGGAGYRASGPGSYINGNSSLASTNGGGGRIAEYGAAIDLTSSSATSNTGVGNLARFGGGLYGDAAAAMGNASHGFQCNVHSWAKGANWSANTNGGWGYRADDLSYMEIPGSGGAGNTLGFDSPGAAGTPENNGSYIEN